MNQNNDLNMGLPSFFKAWFAFCALLGVSMLVAVVYAVYLLFVHFGVVA